LIKYFNIEKMDIEKSIALYTSLLDQIHDPSDDKVTSQWFKDRGTKTFRHLLMELEECILEGEQFRQERCEEAKEALIVLLRRATEIQREYLDKQSPAQYNPFRAALATYAAHQLEGALNLIKPENLFKGGDGRD
jgi:hypothetical protein